MESKKIIDWEIVDWYDNVNGEVDKDNDAIVKIIKKRLAHKYDFRWSNNPRYLLYSVFGDSHWDYDMDCVRICYIGEHIHTDWNLADYGIDLDLMDFGKRHLYYPMYFLWTQDCDLALKKHLITDRREKFCSFMVSNGGGDKMRGEFFEKLCEYKKVDSGGRYKNNIGGPIGDRFGDFSTTKREWLKNYKFNLCFENLSCNGCTSEKLIQAFAAGCIPIYWGDESLCDEKYAHIRPVFNEKAFINVHNFDSVESAIREIKRIDNDENAYNAMRKEPIFTAKSMERFFGLNPKDDLWSSENIEHTAESAINHSEIILANFFDNIFEKGKQIKYGQRLDAYLEQRKKDRKTRILLNKIKLKRRSIEKFIGIYYIRKGVQNYFRTKFGKKAK